MNQIGNFERSETECRSTGKRSDLRRSTERPKAAMYCAQELERQELTKIFEDHDRRWTTDGPPKVTQF